MGRKRTRWVGAKEAEGLEADRVDDVARELRGAVGGVGVAVEVGQEEMGGSLYGGAGVDCGAAVVEVGSWKRETGG